jgi:hypothetical protein
MSCTASGEGLVPGLAWAEGVAEAGTLAVLYRLIGFVIAVR